MTKRGRAFATGRMLSPTVLASFSPRAGGEATRRIRHRVKNVGPNSLNAGFILKTCLKADREPGPPQPLPSSLYRPASGHTCADAEDLHPLTTSCRPGPQQRHTSLAPSPEERDLTQLRSDQKTSPRHTRGSHAIKSAQDLKLGGLHTLMKLASAAPS